MEQGVTTIEFYIENHRSIVLIQSIHVLFPYWESTCKPSNIALGLPSLAQGVCWWLVTGREITKILLSLEFSGLPLAVRANLCMYPYKVQLVHEVKPRTIQQLSWRTMFGKKFKHWRQTSKEPSWKMS